MTTHAILSDLAKRMRALKPGEFDYVAKHPDVTHATMRELEQKGLVKTFLATGYEEVLFYRLTEAGENEVKQVDSSDA